MGPRLHFVESSCDSEVSESALTLTAVCKKGKKKKDTASVKIIKKITVPTSTRKLLLTIRRAEEATAAMKLYASISTEKSDSIVYFPSAMARLANSGDINAFAKLIKTHCRKDCFVTLRHIKELSLSTYLDLFTTTITLHADSVFCMDSTKVVDNQIRASIYYHFTDVPEMYDYAHTFVTDPLLKRIFVGNRAQMLRSRLPLQTLPEQEGEFLNTVLDSQDEICMFGIMDLILTFDDRTRKITNVQYYTRINSITHKNISYKF